MPRTVRVTPAQVNAARLLVKHATASGQTVAPGIQAIASARPAAPALAPTNQH